MGKAYGYTDATLAIDALDHATRLAPNTAAYWMQLGDAQWYNAVADPGAAEASKAAFAACLQRDPRHGDCHCRLGMVQHSQGDHGAALQSVTQAAEHGKCEYGLAQELLELGELERSDALVQARLARIPARPGNFDELYVLQELALQVAIARGDSERTQAARQRLAEYALGVSPAVAFNLGSTYAVARPPQPAEAKQLLERFVQSSCDAQLAAHDCDRCVVARDLLDKIAATRP